MDFKRLLSYIPGWLGFLALIIIGLLMLLNGAIEPFGPVDSGNKAGFIIFGLCALLIGGASWIIGGAAEIKGREGKVGVKVKIQDLPWWGHLINGVLLAIAIIIFLVLSG